MKYRRIGLALVVPALVATACGSGGGSSSSSGAALAANQQFRFPIVDDIKTLDPGHVSDAVSIAPVQNVFGGLYRFDDNLKEVPYIATGHAGHLLGRPDLHLPPPPRRQVLQR